MPLKFRDIEHRDSLMTLLIQFFIAILFYRVVGGGRGKNMRYFLIETRSIGLEVSKNPIIGPKTSAHVKFFNFFPVPQTSCGRGLNGLYLHDPQDITARQGIVWFRWRGWDYTLKKATMMIKPFAKPLNTVTNTNS